MNYERNNIKAMEGYTYGEQPTDVAVVKLNTNENPYPPSPLIKSALKNFDLDVLRRYPDPSARGLRELVASLFDLSPDSVIVTNGGDEGLRLAVTTMVDPGGALGMVDPSYSLYPVLANIQNCRIESLRLEKDWTLPKTLSEHLNASGAQLTCLVNPHAPSGVLCSVETLREIADGLEGVLLIDEAYADFVDPELGYDSIPLIHEFDNVLVLRTLSKGYSLAGLRLGFLIGNATLIEPIANKTRDSYNIDTITQSLALIALNDSDHALKSCAKVRAERARMRDELSRIGFVVPASQANFLLAEVPDPINAFTLYRSLREAKILVRYFDSPPLDQCLRITVGTPGENDHFLKAVSQILQAI